MRHSNGIWHESAKNNVTSGNRGGENAGLKDFRKMEVFGYEAILRVLKINEHDINGDSANWADKVYGMWGAELPCSGQGANPIRVGGDRGRGVGVCRGFCKGWGHADGVFGVREIFRDEIWA